MKWHTEIRRRYKSWKLGKDSIRRAATTQHGLSIDSKTVTYAMLREGWDVVKGDLVGVARRVLSVLALVESHSTDDSRLGILKLSVSSELSSLLLV